MPAGFLGKKMTFWTLKAETPPEKLTEWQKL